MMSDGSRVLLTFDEVADTILRTPAARLIAIDGLPCAGKSTLTGVISQRMDALLLYLDEFALPEASWNACTQPSFPFEYNRYAAFLDAVRSLAATGSCTYFPFDWETMEISQTPRTIHADRPVIVEGVSALNAEICELYGLRFFVESDARTVMEAAAQRGDGHWENIWRRLFLPSIELYMKTDPRGRADYRVAGRGAL